MRIIRGFSFTLAAAVMLSCVASVEATTAIADTEAEYCDFKLYAPSEAEGNTSNLVLERSDLNNITWAEEGGSLYWYIEVADHARSDWEQVISESVGLSISMYCGDELIASPVIRAPLGYEFKITGMESNQRHWK